MKVIHNCDKECTQGFCTVVIPSVRLQHELQTQCAPPLLPVKHNKWHKSTQLKSAAQMSLFPRCRVSARGP